jgi:NAD(P)H dehydrogenase (quinone)
MKHAVILAHPKADSFNAAIAGACVKTLKGLGHQAILRDLYAMDFDPRLQADEVPATTPFAPRPDVVAERALLTDVDSFIFVYPFWFNAPPAMLKGYVDRVMSMGFGYAPGAGGSSPLLTGKSLLTISTSGAPDHWVRSTGALDGLVKAFDEHLAGVFGLTVAGHRHFGGIHTLLADPAADAILKDVATLLRETFPKGAGRKG